jgi:hypothetical protein
VVKKKHPKVPTGTAGRQNKMTGPAQAAAAMLALNATLSTGPVQKAHEVVDKEVAVLYKYDDKTCYQLKKKLSDKHVAILFLGLNASQRPF